MNQFEFGKACQPLNRQYKALFGCIPTPVDYTCTRESYLEALRQAVSEKQPTSRYLPPAKVPSNTRYMY